MEKSQQVSHEQRFANREISKEVSGLLRKSKPDKDGGAGREGL